MENIRSKKIFFINECLVNQNIRAYGVRNMKGEGALAELLNLFLKYGIGLTVIPCPEISYEGLKRTACGKEQYKNKQYKEICKDHAKKFIDRYKLYLDDDYKVGGFICVNGSPSCAIDYCYKDKEGCMKSNEPGIFIEELKKQLEKNSLSLNFIGIKVKELDAILPKIETLMKNM